MEPTKNKTVVICDDHASMVVVLKHLLSNKGFTVLTAGDGGEGLDVIHSADADLLLLDLAMPSKDGMEVLKEIKRMPGKRPYTIVLSGHEGAEKIEQASSLGAQEVWMKPFNPAELLSRIDTLVREGTI